MSSLNENGYWKSLEELERDPELGGYVNEFPEIGESTSDPLSRRNFVQLMGAGLALAGVAGPGCKRYEKEEIVPLERRPEGQVPGTTQEFSTSFELAGFAQALVATSFEGRPIHVDGNPEHPFAGGGSVPGTKRHGGSTAYAQGSILSLYDPDRSTKVLAKGQASTLDAFRSWLAGVMPNLQTAPAKVRVLAEASSSPTLQAQAQRLAETLPGAQWVEWEPISFDNEREGTKMAFGKAHRTLAHLDRCETIVVLDGDIFVEHPASLRYSRDFARSRRPEGGSLGSKMNRLWVVESVFSSTGALADHRLPVRSELVGLVARHLEAALTNGAPASGEFLAEERVKKFLDVLVEELRENRGKAVVLAGRRQPAYVHALVARINGAIGAAGTTLDYLEDPVVRPSHGDAIRKLAQEIDQGQVSALFMIGGNPVYDAPADLKLGEILGKVEHTVHLSEYANETSAKAAWHLPRAHYLEAWGDSRTWDGTWTIGQPLIMPLYGGLSAIELVSMIAGDHKAGYELVRGNVEKAALGTSWRQIVHDGFVPGSYPVAVALQPNPVAPQAPVGGQAAGSRLSNGQLEAVFTSSTTLWDGRYANNPWLQETPDFLTKVTWDNYALLAPATAQDVGAKNGDLVTIKAGGRQIEAAVYTMPGQAPSSIGLVLGGGRTHAGKVGGNGKKHVGFDFYKLRGSDGLDFVSGVTVANTGKTYELAGTQEHWDLRQGLDKDIGERGTAERLPWLVKETSKEKFDDGYAASKPLDFPKVGNRGYSLFKEKVYEGHQWAMAIDLGNCTGCNSCMVACQAENNVPVVGKQQVINEREMHWIRIDRYFRGSVDNPEVVHQPLQCQHCENAPCEQVCPVGATTHSQEGINDIAYNRCVGTRYCLNNCPYRVRRFNFFDYNKEFKEARNKVRNLLFNPEVTVRHRGVIEKCSYCVQRIQNAKIKAKNEQRTMVDGEIVTACQSACPTEAIVFGDLADRESRVSKLHADRRTYELLQDLNTKPRTRFLTRVKNPNPKLVALAPQKGGH